MQRDPFEKAEEQYFDLITEKKFKPRFFWHRCQCCKKEYKKVPMYEITASPIMLSMTNRYVGCTNCFPSMQSFRTWLEKHGYILSKKDFGFMKDINERLNESRGTISKEELQRFLDMHWR